MAPRRSISAKFAGTDRFAVLREIGAGGMGVVYEVFDRDRKQRLALKVLKNVEGGAVYQFKQEFRSLAEVVHPNLVPLYELISDGTQWYFTMELVEDAVSFLAYVQSPADRDASSSASYVSKTTCSLSSPDAESVGGSLLNATGPFSPDSFAQQNAREVSGRGGLKTGVVPDQGSTDDTRTFVHSDAPASLGAVGAGAVDAARKPARLDPAPASRTPVRVVDFHRLSRTFRQLAEGVQALHSAGKLHRDLKPGNALVTRGGHVVLLDFGLVAELSSQGEIPRTPDDQVLSGTISFMSPEQAAGKQLTAASDWYSVGVMLFESLTARLPFSGSASSIWSRKQSEDAPSPADYCDGVPEELNDLCTRLLQRDPSARLTGAEVIAFFSSRDEARRDDDLVPLDDNTRWRTIPFIGREQHVEKLSRAFVQMLSGKTVIVRVHGSSGAGKSTLIQHYLDDLSSSEQTLLLGARCYERELVPYNGIDSLIDALSLFLRRPEVSRELIPENVISLAKLFPVLKQVDEIRRWAESRRVSSDPREVRQDAFQALQELLRRIGRQFLLVVHLDDLQWGDTDSAALLAQLIESDDPPRMLMLLSYRSEYESGSECLRTLAASQSRASPRTLWHELRVDAFSPDETREFARRLLPDDLPNREAGIERIVDQSGGRAYFAFELARHLNSGFDLAGIAGTDLDEVLWSRVGRLSDEEQRFLRVVAVAGSPVALGVALDAADLGGASPRLVSRLRAEHLIRGSGPGQAAEIGTFHDRVRESIVNHLDAENQRKIHGALAVSLQVAEGSAADRIAVHFEGAGELTQASRYYLKAADEAVEVLAFDRSEELYENAVRLAQSDADRAAAAERQIHFLTDMARFADAYAAGREAARHFGLDLPARFVPPLLVADLLLSMVRLRGRPPASLIDLPRMTDRRLELAVRITNAVAKAAYQVRPELCVAVCTKLVNLCLKHGNSRDVAIGYMVYGAIFQGGVLGRHRVGYEFGRLALDLVDRFENERQRAEVAFVVGYFGTSWLRPATEAEALWEIARRSGRENGDLFHTGCACAATVQSLLMRGVALDEIDQQAAEFLEFLEPLHLREAIGAIQSVRQTVRNLRGQTRGPDTLSGPDFDEPAFVATLDGFGSRHFAHFYYVNRMLTHYLWDELEAAAAMELQSRRLLKQSPGMLHAAEHWFLAALISAARAERATGRARRRLLSTVRSALGKLGRWSRDCPHNFLHKQRLVAAELARVSGDTALAHQACQDAREAAQEYGYTQIDALACHCAARIAAASGDPAEPARCQQAAIDAFGRWGATALTRLFSRTE